jgi:plasmid stabilization system protein ParE
MNLPVDESDFIPCDVLDIVRYLRQKNAEAARRFPEAFQATVESLSMMPHVGRRRSDLGIPDIRSWRIRKFPNYLIFYEVFPGRLRLLRLLHSSRDLQAELNR